MPEQEYLDVWSTYLSAWSDISAEGRRKRLECCVVDKCVYMDPTEQCHGRSDLIARIELSKEKYPGSHFENDDFSSITTTALQLDHVRRGSQGAHAWRELLARRRRQSVEADDWVFLAPISACSGPTS